MKKELTCKMAGVLDTSTGRVYTEKEIKSNPELKKYIEKKMNENINRALSAM